MDEIADNLLTTSQAASLLQVHESSIKRWCNQGVLAVHKTEGGHRRIPLGELAEFATSKQLSFPFQSFDDGLRLCDALLLYWREQTLEPFFDIGVEWLMEETPPRLVDMVLELYQRFSPSLAMIGEQLICRWMHQIGRLWQDGQWSVLREHLWSQEIFSLLHALRESMLARGAEQHKEMSGKLAIVGAAEGVYHEIGAFCVRLLLEERGWEVLYLGANVPTDELAALQQEENARVVCLSLVPPLRRADLMRHLRTLGQAYDAEKPYVLVVGGSTLLEEAEESRVGMLTYEHVTPGKQAPLRYDTFSSLRDFEGWLAHTLPEVLTTWTLPSSSEHHREHLT